MNANLKSQIPNPNSLYGLLIAATFLLVVRSLALGAVVVSQTPVNGGGISRWSQLWQDPGPGGNDLDSDAICWEDFTLQSTTAITHIEWWGTGACELGFQIEFWPQDPGTIAYQPLAVFDRGPGPSPVTPTARFAATPADYQTNSAPGGLTHFSLDLPTAVTLAATNSSNPRWFIGIIGLTHQAYATWNWSQGLGGSTRTFQWYRGDANNFRSLGEGRALLLAAATVEAPPVLNISLTPTNTIVLRWPTNALGFVLQENVLCDTSNWADATYSVTVVDGENCAVVPTSATCCFYRLFHP